MWNLQLLPPYHCVRLHFCRCQSTFFGHVDWGLWFLSFLLSKAKEDKRTDSDCPSVSSGSLNESEINRSSPGLAQAYKYKWMESFTRHVKKSLKSQSSLTLNTSSIALSNTHDNSHKTFFFQVQISAAYFQHNFNQFDLKETALSGRRMVGGHINC